jgi:sirohydrochlorin cobaltochelatase
MTQEGLLLFAHGARDPAWARPFEAIAARIAAARPALPLALAYLELMEPRIESAAAELIARGCSRIHIVPMFLGASGHVRRDVPPLVEALRAQHGGEWLLHPAIGEQEAVVAAMAAASLDLITTRTAP